MTHHSRQHNRPYSIGISVRALTKGRFPAMFCARTGCPISPSADARMTAEAIGINHHGGRFALHHRQRAPRRGRLTGLW
jgi:hypothetical protein